MNTIDLQIQTTASDGKHSPRECVKMAAGQGLRVVAITDHDTVDGVPDALLAAGELGIRVIPGIEISAEERGVHILGYGISYDHRDLKGYCDRAKRDRIEAAKKTVENLGQAGFNVDWEDVFRQASGGVVARPHIARAILARPENKGKLGSISTVHELIEAYLIEKSPYYARRSHISVKDATSLIHRCGGVAVWSHPAVHFENSYDELEKFLQELVAWGIDGMEVLNPSHTEDDVEFLQGLAAKYRLLRTAGSDFHEKGEHPRDPTTGLHSAKKVGDYETHGFPTNDIIPKLDEAMNSRRQETAAISTNSQ